MADAYFSLLGYFTVVVMLSTFIMSTLARQIYIDILPILDSTEKYLESKEEEVSRSSSRIANLRDRGVENIPVVETRADIKESDEDRIQDNIEDAKALHDYITTIATPF